MFYLFFEESEQMTFSNVDQASIDLSVLAADIGCFYTIFLAQDVENSGHKDWDLRLVDVDGVGEDFDEEVGVDQGPENGRVVAGKIFNLAMADLDVNLETTKKFFTN